MIGPRIPSSRLPSLAHATSLLLLLLLPLVDGCGMSVMGHRIPSMSLHVPFLHHRSHVSAHLASKPPSGMEGKIAEAREQMALQPHEPYWPYSIAKLEVEADSLAAAERDLQVALERNPDYVPALALQTRLDYRNGHHAEAIRRLEAARERTAGFPNGLPPVLAAGLALHYDALDRVDLAREAIASAPPTAREAEGARVYLTLRGAHPDSAVAFAKDALDGDPRSAVNQNNWGITRLRAGDPTAAEKAFRRAIELDPALAGPYYNLAILEKYYRFDDDAATRWFGLYWDRSHADPDGLASVFGKTAPAPLAGGKDD